MAEHIQEWKSCEISNKAGNLTIQLISIQPPENLDGQDFKHKWLEKNAKTRVILIANSESKSAIKVPNPLEAYSQVT